MSCRSIRLAEKRRVGSGGQSDVSDRKQRLPESCKLERKTVNNITVDRSLCRISINGVKPGNAPKIMRLLAANGITAGNITDLAGGESHTLSFSVPEKDYRRTAGILEAYNTDPCRAEIQTETNLAMFTVIGSGAGYDSSITAMYYDTLMKENVEIYYLSLSEMKISALVDEHAVDRAVSCLRARFMEEGILCPPERTVKSHEKEEDLHRLRSSGDYSFYIGRNRLQIVQENNRLSAGKRHKGDNSLRYDGGSPDALGI